MKKILFVLALTFSLLAVSNVSVVADEKNPAHYEYAIVKWDGPDRVYYNLPDKFELVYLSKEGVVIPKEAQNEEFCLAYAANKMAKAGWEPVNLDSRRIVFRRAAK